MSRLSFRARIVAVVLALVAAGLGAAFAGASRAMHRTVTDSLTEHLGSRAVEVLDAAGRARVAALETLSTWAETESMGKSLDSADRKFAEDYLLRTVDESAFAAVALVDASHHVITAVRARGTGGDGPAHRIGALLDQSAVLPVEPGGLRLALVTPSLEALLAHAGSDATALVGMAPVRDFTGEQVGTLVGVFARRPMEKLLEALAHESTGAALVPMVFERSRAVVIAPRESAAAADLGQLQDLWAKDPSAARTGTRLELGGTPYLAYGASEPVSPSLAWSVALLVREDEALGPLRSLQRTVVLTFLVVLVLITLFTVAAVGRIAAPLKRVVASMDQVAAGDLTVRLPAEPTPDLNRMVTAFNGMVKEVDDARRDMVRAEAMRRELEIAHRIQTSILPRPMPLPGYTVAAKSKPASEVGGDFYDLIPTENGFWVIVGDVSGHGLDSGLIMLMLQAAAQASIAAKPQATPSDVFGLINKVIHENVRHRMGSHDYATLVVVHCGPEGRFTYAGSHCPLIVARAHGEVEFLDVMGPWCGVAADVSRTLTESTFTLVEGETLLIYTDGLSETMDPARNMFGDEGMRAVVDGAGRGTAVELVDALFSRVEAWGPAQDDDRTAVAIRRGMH